MSIIQAKRIDLAYEYEIKLKDLYYLLNEKTVVITTLDLPNKIIRTICAIKGKIL